MIRQEIVDRLEEFRKSIVLHPLSKERAQKIHEELQDFISDNNVTKEELRDFKNSRAGEMLYMIRTIPD